MVGWRGRWAAAQITGVLFSTMIWLMAVVLAPLAVLAMLVLGVSYIAGRGTGAGLRWRFGVRQATGFERDTVAAAIVPIAALRGRRQPRIWISPRLTQQVVMAGEKDLIIGQALSGWVANAPEVRSAQFSALVSHALGQQPVHSSALVATIDAYTLPWSIVRLLGGVVVGATARVPLVSLAWTIRWLVFGVAIVDSAHNGRWPAFYGVIVIAVLSWSTGWFQRRWAAALTRLGDERVIRDGFGPALATMINRPGASVVDRDRARLLSQGRAA